MVWTNVPSLCNFLKILSGYGLKYNFYDTSYYSPLREFLYINDGAAAD